jgi:hypothetical protein
MPPRQLAAAFVLGVVVGGAAGAGGGWVAWRRPARALGARVTALEAAAGEVQAERDRLHAELSGLVRERREMADAAEHLRAQVERQLRRLEALAEELAPPAEGGEAAPP